LKLQSNWYNKVSQIDDFRIPKVLYCGEDGDFFVLDLSDLGSLKNLNQELELCLVSEKSKFISAVLNDLDKLYSPFISPSAGLKNSSQQMRDFLIHEKALPAIKSLSSHPAANINFDNSSSDFYINGKKIQNPVSKLLKIAEYGNSFQAYESNFKTLIHGDLTFENILYSEQGPVFIDPLGAFMDPQLQTNPKLHLENASPMWDLIKLLQSSVLSYEKWSTVSGILELSGPGRFEFENNHSDLFVDSNTRQIIAYFSRFELDLSDENIKFMLAILLFRLIPYKLSISLESALYCYALGTEILGEV
jgi:hypothetical protein